MPPSDGTQSITRAIQLLKCFDDETPYQELSSLVERTRLNKTTVFRILGALENEGLIEKCEDGSYRLGAEMIALGGRAARANNLRAIGNHHLKQLTQCTGETTTLEILRQNSDYTWSMLVIDEVLGKYLVGITQYIGSRLPVHATSTGKAVLAHINDSRFEEIVTGHLSQLTDDTIVSIKQLRLELAEVRQAGYAMAVNELEQGLVAIGSPILDHNGEVQAAISLVGPNVRLHTARIKELTGLVCDTALTISRQIGYRESVWRNS